MIASAVDMAAWDALGVAADLPLATLLGSAPKPIAAYNSNGLGLIGPEEAADEAEKLLAEGFQCRQATARTARSRRRPCRGAGRAQTIPSNTFLMLDFNQALSFADGHERCRALDGEGAYWIEEPIRHDDYAHCAMVADCVQTPIQIGENISSLAQLASALR